MVLQVMDVADIINNCASTHWGDRKEGLMQLHAFLRGSSMLTGSELKKIKDIFTKMFMDAHTKVNSGKHIFLLKCNY